MEIVCEKVRKNEYIWFLGRYYKLFCLVREKRENSRVGKSKIGKVGRVRFRGYYLLFWEFEFYYESCEGSWRIVRRRGT